MQSDGIPSDCILFTETASGLPRSGFPYSIRAPFHSLAHPA